MPLCAYFCPWVAIHFPVSATQTRTHAHAHAQAALISKSSPQAAMPPVFMREQYSGHDSRCLGAVSIAPIGAPHSYALRLAFIVSTAPCRTRCCLSCASPQLKPSTMNRIDVNTQLPSPLTGGDQTLSLLRFLTGLGIGMLRAGGLGFCVGGVDFGFWLSNSADGRKIFAAPLKSGPLCGFWYIGSGLAAGARVAGESVDCGC